MSELLGLFFIFFRIGLFTIGGGYVIISLVQQELVTLGYMTLKESIDMVAISQMTPGAFGINAATFTGMRLYGIWGGLAATLGVMLPSVVICILVAKFFFTFNKKPLVRSAMMGLRPVVFGLITSALLTIAEASLFPSGFFGFDWPVAAIAVVVFVLMVKTKINPVYLILGSGVLGALLFH